MASAAKPGMAEGEHRTEGAPNDDPPKLGRPSLFTPELADRICELIATTNRGLDWICSQDQALPSARTVHRWLNEDAAFCQNYLRARERQADLIFDECLEIADDGSHDVTIEKREDGSEYEQFNAERVARSKLRVDTRMRMAGKLAPKKYGDKSSVEVSGVDGAPLVPVQIYLPSNGRDA